jgi:hypothetical protein
MEPKEGPRSPQAKKAGSTTATLVETRDREDKPKEVSPFALPETPGAGFSLGVVGCG